MAYLNANIPATYAQIRREYLYDLKKHHGEVEDCIIFGITSIGWRAILWHALWKMAQSFIVSQLGIYSTRFQIEDCSKKRLDELELWNSFSYYPTVTSWNI